MGLARAGADVAVLDLLEEELAQTCKEVETVDVQAMGVTIDLSELDRIPPAIELVLARFGRIDILVNGAAIGGWHGSIVDIELEALERLIRIDLIAPMVMMQQCARTMIQKGEGGRIVNISSSAAFRSAVGSSATQIDYAAAKAGLVGASRSAAGQLAPHDINVNCVAPGVTGPSALTPGTMTGRLDPAFVQQMVDQGGSENLFHRVSTPEDVAAAIVFLCLPGSRQITAQTIHTSAGNVVV
jgi:NAD(P)-dependent dehydrogenase (short-subunit alcohol dehydrogenase family)